MDISSFATKTNLASLKSEFDKLHINELKVVPIYMSKLSDVVKNEVVKKTEFNTLKTKVDNIDTDDYVLKTKYDSEIGNLQLKIPDIDGIAQSSTLNSKLTELENKIPDVKNFATKSDIISAENKIPDIKNSASKTKVTVKYLKNKIPNVSNLVLKTDYAREITKIKNDYVTNAALDARHKNLVQKTTFESEFKKNDDKVSVNSSNVLTYEHKLKQRDDTINDIERDASYFRGKNYFGDDGMQNYFVFQPMYKYFKKVIDSTDNTVYVHYWQSKGLSDGKINAPGTSSSNDQAPILEYGGTGIRLKFKRDSLRQNKVTYNYGKIVNIYTAYEISSTLTSQSSFTLKNSLFGAIKITKNADTSKYKYSGYGIGFDSKGSFFHVDGTYDVNVILFGADLSSSTHANNRANNILVLGKYFIQGINGRYLITGI